MFRIPEAPDLPLLYAEICKEVSQEPRPSGGVLHPSSLKPRAQACLRKLQYEYLNAKVENNNARGELAQALQYGAAIDLMLEQLAERLPFPAEMKVDARHKNLPIGGEVDQIVRYKGLLWLVENKSCKKERLIWMSAPIKRHVYQLHGYMMLTGIPRGVIYYIPKNPWMTMVSLCTDLVQMLRRSGAEGLALSKQIEAWLHEEEIVIAEEADDDEFAGNDKEEPLGKKFVVFQDDAIVAEIEEMTREVVEACEKKVWLKKDTKGCNLCPYARYCFAQTPMDEVPREDA